MLMHIGVYDTCLNKVDVLGDSKADYTTITEAAPVFRQKWRLENNTNDRMIFTDFLNYYYVSHKLAGEVLVADL